ncbi:hypothetical protein GLOIN_2v1762049 [Rhizophagus irregularis DAOM 181602=DAOM 197198]|nr:hypothetical protein GLOIN_2v1762049 [Rhizophagus irregularis DAOM 181602=DAOM 197198]
MPPKGNKKAGNNPNGGPAKRQDKRNKNKDSGSDVSNSDNEQINNKNNSSKRTRTLPENPMEEDFVADSAADAGGSNTTPPQQNNANNFSSPPPKDTTVPSAPGSVASGTDASMHAPKDKETSPLDALIIHFNSTTERDACLSLQHEDFTDLRFFLHDPQQLRTDEDLRAIQITDIPFFIKKDDIIALFKKYGNIQSCRLYTRANAKV